MTTLAANALTTLAEMKAELGITDTASDDALCRGINVASSAIVQFCNRTFHRETSIVEKVAGANTPTVALSRTPIRAITTLTENESALTEGDDFEVENADAGLLRKIYGSWYYYGPSTGGVNFEPLYGMERPNIEVDYDGGFITPQQEIDNVGWVRDLPFDVEQAAIITASSLFIGRGRDRSVAAERALSGSVQYAGRSRVTGRGAGGIIPDDAAILLSMWRRVC